MKITGLLFCLFLASCAVPKARIVDLSVLKQYSTPLTIDEIGYWPPDYMILTLVDANHKYFTIKVKRNDRLKRGDRYQDKP